MKRINKLLILVLVLAGLAGCRKPEAPEYYGFQDLHIGRGEGQQATLGTTLKFYNPNPFSLQLKRAEMDVLLNGRPAGHSVLDSTVLIPKKDTFYVPVTMQLNLQGVLSNALQIFLEKQVTVTLDGRVHLKRGAIPFSRPFHYEGKEDLNALLQGAY
ncbi:MAG: LEA type 2 family protein [Chitinophagaceae bacterium]|nr:LEA type 2 family protein [Chitinophagaceae bacterium]